MSIFKYCPRHERKFHHTSFYVTCWTTMFLFFSLGEVKLWWSPPPSRSGWSIAHCSPKCPLWGLPLQWPNQSASKETQDRKDRSSLANSNWAFKIRGRGLSSSKPLILFCQTELNVKINIHNMLLQHYQVHVHTHTPFIFIYCIFSYTVTLLQLQGNLKVLGSYHVFILIMLVVENPS